MGSNDKKEFNDWVNRLQIYQTCIDSEQSIRTSYQSLLATLEVAIFGLFFILIELQLTEHIWFLPIVGILLCFIFGTACDFRAKNVDFWRKRIINVVKGTNLEGDFKRGKYGHPDEWHPFFEKTSRFGKLGRLGDRLFGHWFERILIPLIILAWLLILLLS